jgi:hypothetical protein
VAASVASPAATATGLLEEYMMQQPEYLLDQVQVVAINFSLYRQEIA